MSQLIGEFDCKLDAKGRLMVPSGLRRQLPMVETSGLMINRGFEKHLVIYSKEEWDKIANELANLNPYEEKNRMFVRYFNRGATALMLDASGRVLLPKSLLEYAGIGSEVVLSCMFNKIEVWNKKAYDEQLDNEPMNFASLAEEVMGSGRRNDGV